VPQCPIAGDATVWVVSYAPVHSVRPIGAATVTVEREQLIGHAS